MDAKSKWKGLISAKSDFKDLKSARNPSIHIWENNFKNLPYEKKTSYRGFKDSDGYVLITYNKKVEPYGR